MKNLPAKAYQKFLYNKCPINKQYINLDISLFNGQSFIWNFNPDSEVFYGQISNNYFEFKYDDNKDLLYYTNSNSSQTEAQNLQIDYFDLKTDYDKSFGDEFTAKDEYFKEQYLSKKGLRVLRQEPWECQISFLTSQNNNIKRISAQVQSQCTNYGQNLYQDSDITVYGFPSLEILSKVTEQEFRDLGFGYRAKYLVETCNEIKKRGSEKYLIELREDSYDEKILSLRSQKGVGPKVADCVALFSLDCHDVVPIDTHMWQLYQSKYHKKTEGGQGKKLANMKYDVVKQDFRNIFGEWAGVIHSFQFSSQLKELNKKLAEATVKNDKGSIGSMEIDVPKDKKRRSTESAGEDEEVKVKKITKKAVKRNPKKK